MSNKTYLVAFGSFFVGLLFGVGGGYFCGIVRSGKEASDALALMKQIEMAESGHRAFAAYQHEPPQVAAYALTSYLAMLQNAGTDSLSTDANFDTMLAHARLAKVYASAGQPDLSKQHVADALKCASRDRKLETITNEVALMEIIARVDKGATK